MAWMIGNILRNAVVGPSTRQYPYVARNPFMLSRGQLTIEKEKCIYCTACARRCPASAFEVNRLGKTFVFDPQRCVFCGLCAEVCPKDCLNMAEMHRTPYSGGHRQYIAFRGDAKEAFVPDK